MLNRRMVQEAMYQYNQDIKIKSGFVHLTNEGCLTDLSFIIPNIGSLQNKYFNFSSYLQYEFLTLEDKKSFEDFINNNYSQEKQKYWNLSAKKITKIESQDEERSLISFSFKKNSPPKNLYVLVRATFDLERIDNDFGTSFRDLFSIGEGSNTLFFQLFENDVFSPEMKILKVDKIEGYKNPFQEQLSGEYWQGSYNSLTQFKIENQNIPLESSNPLLQEISPNSQTFFDVPFNFSLFSGIEGQDSPIHASDSFIFSEFTNVPLNDTILFLDKRIKKSSLILKKEPVLKTEFFNNILYFSVDFNEFGNHFFTPDQLKTLEQSGGIRSNLSFSRLELDDRLIKREDYIINSSNYPILHFFVKTTKPKKIKLGFDSFFQKNIEEIVKKIDKSINNMTSLKESVPTLQMTSTERDLILERKKIQLENINPLFFREFPVLKNLDSSNLERFSDNFVSQQKEIKEGLERVKRGKSLGSDMLFYEYFYSGNNIHPVLKNFPYQITLSKQEALEILALFDESSDDILFFRDYLGGKATVLSIQEKLDNKINDRLLSSRESNFDNILSTPSFLEEETHLFKESDKDFVLLEGVVSKNYDFSSLEVHVLDSYDENRTERWIKLENFFNSGVYCGIFVDPNNGNQEILRFELVV